MIRRPPGSTRTDPLVPSTTLFRSCAGWIAAPLQQACAQEFTLFEHAVVKPEPQEMPGRQYLPADHTTGRADISYREGLYLAAIAETDRKSTRLNSSH